MVTAGCSCDSEQGVAMACVDGVDQAATVLRRHFHRPEAYRHALDYLQGLIATAERKNGWQLAEHAGYPHPRGIQRVLDRYAWDADAVRDDLQTYVIAQLGHPEGVLLVDETGFLKQEKHSVGVAPPILRHGRQDRQLPDWSLAGLRQSQRQRRHRSGVVRA